MNKKTDVVALGELLMDMTNNGISAQGNCLYEANPGGAPCNVLAMLSKLGHSTAFIGKVGDDLFGRELKEVIEAVGIDSSALVTDKEIRTTLAFVKNFEDGDRDFSFYRNPGADRMLKKEEISSELLRNARIFHCGTLSMTHEPARSATLYALKAAKEAGALISFDPNIRKPLWDDMEDARQQVYAALAFCDILKISDNEILWLTDQSDYTEGVRRIRERFPIPLITVSLGKNGSLAYYGKGDDQDAFITAEAPAFLQPDTLDTTGAGDTFGACVLHTVLEKGLFELSKEDLDQMLTFANAAASITTTRRGALRVMPELCQIEELIRQRKG